MRKELILYPGLELHIMRGDKKVRVRIRKLYSTYAMCDVGKHIEPVSFTELLERSDETKKEI